MSRAVLIIAALAVLGFGAAFAIARSGGDSKPAASAQPEPLGAPAEVERIPVVQQGGEVPPLKPAKKKRSSGGSNREPASDSDDEAPSDSPDPQPSSPSPSAPSSPRPSSPRPSAPSGPSNPSPSPPPSNDNDDGPSFGGG